MGGHRPRAGGVPADSQASPLFMEMFRSEAGTPGAHIH